MLLLILWDTLDHPLTHWDPDSESRFVDLSRQVFFLFAFLTQRRMIIGADQNDQISGSRTLTWCPSCSPVNILPASAQRSINAEQPSAKTPIIVFRKRPDMGQAVTKFEDLGNVDFKIRIRSN